jgi:predicted membrane channel-forming protein YqfA (hemolysin III family)
MDWLMIFLFIIHGFLTIIIIGIILNRISFLEDQVIKLNIIVKGLFHASEE